jgi:hypothetical protein
MLLLPPLLVLAWLLVLRLCLSFSCRLLPTSMLNLLS